MRKAKAEWIRRLRALCDNQAANIRFNDSAGRWEFQLPEADGELRSQFWCHFDQPADPYTGLGPFRELDDSTINAALRNLEESFIGNRVHRARSKRDEMHNRMDENRERRIKVFRQAGIDFADYVSDHRKEIIRRASR